MARSIKHLVNLLRDKDLSAQEIVLLSDTTKIADESSVNNKSFLPIETAVDLDYP